MSPTSNLCRPPSGLREISATIDSLQVMEKKNLQDILNLPLESFKERIKTLSSNDLKALYQLNEDNHKAFIDAINLNNPHQENPDIPSNDKPSLNGKKPKPSHFFLPKRYRGNGKSTRKTQTIFRGPGKGIRRKQTIFRGPGKGVRKGQTIFRGPNLRK
jgi:DNA modification methylase